MSEKWIRAAFDDVVFDITSKGVKLPQSKYEANGLIPIVDQGQSFIAGYTNETKGVFRDLPAIIFGDHTRALKYADFRFFLGADGTKILKPKVANVDCKYMYFFLGAHPVPNTGYNRHYSWLKRIDVFFPQSLSTQCHIAEVLSTCDEVIEQSERAVEKYRQIKAGMLKDLLTRGIDNRGKMRPPPSVAPELYKDSELGPIPREWKVKKFEDVLVDDTKCCEKIQTSEYGITGEIPVVDQSQNYISGYVDAEYAVYDKVPVIIFGDHTRVLKYVDFNFVLGADGAKVLQLNDKAVSLRYLYYYLIQNPVPNTGYNRHFSWLRKMQIAIPSNLAEQRAIAERLAAVDERIAAEVKAAEKYRKVKSGLMEKLLTPPADAEIEDLTQEVAG